MPAKFVIVRHPKVEGTARVAESALPYLGDGKWSPVKREKPAEREIRESVTPHTEHPAEES